MSPVDLKLGDFDLVLTANQKFPLIYDNDSDRIGSGNSGSVYRATLNCSHNFEVLDNNKVAVKVIPDKDITTGESAATVEIRALKAIKNISSTNPNIATCYGAFKHDDKTYVLFELATSDLTSFMVDNSIVNRSVQINLPWLRSQLRGLAQALHAVHTVPDKSVFHHDIKPENILFCGLDQPFKITDWGCAGVKPFSGHFGLGSPSSKVKGNPFYTPPECRGDKPSSRSHDIWSLGCVFLELLTWYSEGWDALQTFRRKIENNPAYKTDWANADKSALLGDVLDKMVFLNANFTRQINVICRMLNVVPAARPQAQVVANGI